MGNRFLLFLISFFILAIPAFSQNADTLTDKSLYLPDIDGVIKTKVEFNSEKGKMRFEVRNARFGAKGKVNKYVSYRTEVDLSDEGKIKMLDAYAQVTPITNLNLSLGQRKIPFGSDYLRSPADNLFANRSFVAKYVNDGLRDIGFVANYNLKCKVPIELWASAMNGTGNNNPQWIEVPNYSGRITISPFKNFRIASNFYQGNTKSEIDLTMFGGELRYQTENFLIETEYIKRQFKDTLLGQKSQEGFYVHAFYNFNTHYKLIKRITPLLRWDIMGKEVFSSKKDSERITGGITFGFDAKQFIAELRLNYEDYLMSNYSYHFDKFVIELVAKF